LDFVVYDLIIMSVSNEISSILHRRLI